MKNKNNTDPILVVLAAGLGSRYGSLKQTDKFGPFGEALVDYTIYDAIRANFKKIVFVIRKRIELEFVEIFYNKVKHKVKVDFVFQELDILPKGFEVPENRTKPWGTAHAVLMAASKVDAPFAIVNADDFYGRESLSAIYNHLRLMDPSKMSACLIGFVLKNTLSDHGLVSRGICALDSKSNLVKITERTHIYKSEMLGAYFMEGDKKCLLHGEEVVSMNLMGFTPEVFSLISTGFETFLNTEIHDLKSEYHLPKILDAVRASGISVPVIPAKSSWFGVTYKEDKPIVRRCIEQLVDEGKYPAPLWK